MAFCYSLSNVILLDEKKSFQQFLRCCHKSNTFVASLHSAVKWIELQLTTVCSSLEKLAGWSNILSAASVNHDKSQCVALAGVMVGSHQPGQQEHIFFSTHGIDLIGSWFLTDTGCTASVVV